MELKQSQIVTHLKNGVISSFPLLGPIMQKLEFEIDDNVKTAETNGKWVKFSSQFMATLSFEEKVALLAHEILHVAFDHIMRSQNRNPYYWNIATDAVINQIILDAKLPLPEGAINIAVAKGKSAEEMYDYVVQHKDQFPEDKQNESTQGTGDGENQIKTGDHQSWQDAVEQARQSEQESESQQGQAQRPSLEKSSAREKEFTKANNELKKKMAEEIMEKLKQDKDEGQSGKSQGYSKTQLGKIDETKPVENWQNILKRKLNEREQAFWSYRRAGKSNDWQPRVEHRYFDDKAIVEVMLDTSGSVDDVLLKGFLAEIKNLIKNADLKVGCFDAEFYGFHEIKKQSEIDQFEIVGRGGTSFDTALSHFSKERNNQVYKIIFTDGLDKVSDTPENRRIKNLFWLVWREVDFKPCCGKVLKVDPYEIRSNKFIDRERTM